MKVLSGFFWLVVTLLMSATLPTTAVGTESSDAQKLEKTLAHLLTPLGNGVGLSLMSLRDKEVVSISSETPRRPASIIKLFSTACALKELGPAFQFETVFGTAGKIVGDRLKGDLVVRGSGDPRFVIEELREVLERLRGLYGIKTIEGDLVFDLSYLAQKEISFSNNFEGDDNRAFNAPITALPFNFNSFGAAGASFEGKTFVSLLPRGLEALKIENAIKIGKAHSLSVSQKSRDHIVVGGSLEANDEGRVFYRSLEDPLQALADQVFFIWEQTGGVWNRKASKIRYELKPQSFRSLLTWKSPPLSKMLIDINKLSTNFGAELVTLRAAASRTARTPVSLEDSRRFLQACWQEAGLSPQNFRLENASGLSRVTTVSPRDLAQFLITMAKDWRYPEFASSLSILGEDGTARKRLSDFAGRGRVKTGSIQGVRSIAGYLHASSGTYTFVMIYQGEKTALALELEDRVMREILENL